MYRSMEVCKETITNESGTFTHFIGWVNPQGVHITGCGFVIRHQEVNENVAQVNCKTCINLFKSPA